MIPKNNYAAYGAKNYRHNPLIHKVCSPIDNQEIGSVAFASEQEYEQVVTDAEKSFQIWRKIPAPQRGLILKEIGLAISKQKDDLAELITKETGKIYEESRGEVQEAIDIIDFALGLSRQLAGQTMKSERPNHQMLEQWHPLGIVGVITAFNFPMAVWAWNAAIAAVCGNVILWKPSELTPLSAIAINNLAREVMEKMDLAAVFSLVLGAAQLGQRIAEDPRVALVSATGSSKMGRSVAESVAKRFGKSLLELGGNNAVIVLDDANLELALPAIVFGAVGTAGQRCTSTRRLIIQKNIKERLIARLIKAYQSISIGNPLSQHTLVGPLINQQAVNNYLEAIKIIQEQGGKILFGGKLISNLPSGLYVEPTLVEASTNMKIIKQETFAPILYLLECSNLEEAIKINNDVPQGLSSAIFTNSISSAGIFISESGSDCGIANVNIGTSGAEIGGAFGGEKETGGGRESGSDAWKSYMRRQTTTINYGEQTKLAQGVKFQV